MQAGSEELARSISERRAILFVGAGPSISVGLPSWDSLIDRMAEELGLDRELIGGPECTYQTLAEYFRIRRGDMEPLRRWMARNWRVSRAQVERSELHRLIVALDFPIVYTTNYDRNLEVAYEACGRDYVKITSPRDIARAGPEITQIVKFHGDFDDEESLVLAESDYFSRLSFESPLDIKFRSDTLGRTVLFIGYSMSDVNIRFLLHRLWQTWLNSGYEQDRPKSYVFMPTPHPVQQAVLERWGLCVLAGESNDPEVALRQFLSGLKASVDARVAATAPEGG